MKYLLLALLLAGCTSLSNTINPRPQPAQVYPVEYLTVFNAATHTAALLEWEITGYNKAQGLIVAKVPASAWTNGGRVTIQLHEHTPGRVEVDVVSTIAQEIDLGQSVRNAKRFYKALTKRLAPMLEGEDIEAPLGML